jgi:hypothetical protein
MAGEQEETADPTQMCQYDRINFWKIRGGRMAEGQVGKVNEEEEKAW